MSDIDGFATKTAKLMSDEEIKDLVLPPDFELEYIETMDLDLRNIAQNRSSVIPPENIVKLNIGGTKFETSKLTLTKLNGVFKEMLEADVSIPKDASDCIFIDRSPKHFELILNFMRDGKIEFPSSVREVKEIQNEAQYYQMAGLEEMCKGKIRKMTETNSDKTPFDEEVQFISSHNQLLQTIAEPKKPVLIIYYHVDSFGRTIRPRGFFIKPFLDRFKHKMDIFFKAFTNNQTGISSTKSIWLWSLHYGKDWSYPGTVKEGEWTTMLGRDISAFLIRNSIML